MIDIFTPEAQATLRSYLVDAATEGALKAFQLAQPSQPTSAASPPAADPVSAPVVTDGATPGSTPAPAHLPPDISTAPPTVTDQPTTSAPSATTSPTDAATAPAVANLPFALAPADTRYFQRSLWCDMRVRFDAAQADQAVTEFNQRWPQ